jgi:hypothetical protein
MLFFKVFIRFYRYFVAYLDRYRNIKIFQGQAAGDQFFLLDSEVCSKFKIDVQIFCICRITFGLIYKLQLVDLF